MRVPVSLGRPYAKAVFDLGKETGTLPQWTRNLQALAAAGASHHLVTTLKRRHDKEALALLLKVCEGVLDEPGKALAALLISQNRLAAAGRILEIFDDLCKEDQGLGIVEITSVVPLSEDQKRDLISNLEKRFVLKLEARYQIDPTILGGYIARVGDEVLDASVRGGLDRLGQILKP